MVDECPPIKKRGQTPLIILKMCYRYITVPKFLGMLPLDIPISFLPLLLHDAQ